MASSASPAAYFFSGQPIFFVRLRIFSPGSCILRAAFLRNGFQNETFEKTMQRNTARKGRIKQNRPFFIRRHSNLVAKQHRAKKCPHKAKTSVSKIKTFQNLCHCEERSDAAIFKPKVWHPVAKHGALARRISNILEIKVVGFIAKPTIFVSLRGAQRRSNLKVIDVASRGETRELETTKSRNF